MVAELLEDDEDRLDLIDCPVLVTERLVLRAPHAEDVDAIARLADNPRVAEMLSRMPHPYTQDHAVDFVRRANAGEIGKCVYAITLAQSGTFIGCCGINYRRNSRSRRAGSGTQGHRFQEASPPELQAYTRSSSGTDDDPDRRDPDGWCQAFEDCR